VGELDKQVNNLYTLGMQKAIELIEEEIVIMKSGKSCQCDRCIILQQVVNKLKESKND
jgi:hypothetical protein